MNSATKVFRGAEVEVEWFREWMMVRHFDP